LRHSLTELTVTRGSIKLLANNNTIQFEVGGTLEHIDADTRKKIRKETTQLELLDTEKYGTNATVEMINLISLQPLIHAASENHHCRELTAEGALGYIKEKTDEVWSKIQHYPDDTLNINYKNVHAFVCYWIKNIVIPRVRESVSKKLEYYESLLLRDDIGNIVKKHINLWIAKNNKYQENIDELSFHTDINEQSTIFIEREQS
jgi:hypothetical protein